MTGMCPDLGQRGDVAVGATILEAHRQCPDCRAGTCEAGAYAAQLLAEHRRKRAAALAR
ncbi:hypothetical protein [Micromonospora sp. WMMD980]|uniref:hypothetical protein n=1 Tax=Micromonospora sp. WMMD980 TaxID=3016088 RepID=UPI00241656A4|nr:hypothetical protein [Micromonospora sp. WMMD980]MDG4798987.1 hypothetical protein [Micromonospora sp. WMMD980]MDG4799009.1 hypothetical protein [Micromonospora sp. WMMD980]MDG4799075.1 hypothetical protein [Micromonospora sp. WMMD980]